MSVSYPITLPSGLASVEPIAESLAGITASPFTAQQQIIEWPGQFWRMKCAYPPLQRAKAELVISALLSLRGMVGTFLLGDPLGKTPQGTAGGSPIVSGAGQAGKQLAISGLTGVLKAGDYFHIGSAGENMLLQSQALATAPWQASGSGVAAPTVTNNAAVAPDGTSTATSVVYPVTAGGQFSDVLQLVTFAAALQIFVYSIYLKVASGTATLTLALQDNPFTTVLGSATANVTTSWQRFSFVTASAPANVSQQLYFVVRQPPSTAAQTVLAWGAQLERGAVLNNYIPTTTLASGPTRQLLKNLVDAGPGSVTLDIFPKLRTSPLNADPLILTNSVGLFRLTSNSTPWSVDKAKFYGIAFEAVEAP